MICTVVFWYGHHHAGRTKRVYALSALTYTGASRHRLGAWIGKSLPEAWALINSHEKSMYTSVAGDRA